MRAVIVGLALIVCVGAAGVYRLASPYRTSIGAPRIDLPIRAIQFSADEGAILRGWFVPAQDPKGIVVLMHGVHANRLQMLDRARFLYRAGFSSLLFDSRAHGESGGDTITFGHLESRDARTAVQLARELAPRQPVAVIGVSLGARQRHWPILRSM